MTTGPNLGEEQPDRDQLPATFGSYLLLHRIARGGMGNVFLAKTSGSMGIEKHCVVKTLREAFTADAEYVERFAAEARVVVQLSHRNICQVFDVGRVGDGYYLAMELVLGRDVRALLTRLAERGQRPSQSVAVHIVAEMLDALDYAHRHVDPVTGEPLHLVHRDVSPQNVLLNFEGEVKLIDFGLAETGRPPAVEANSTGSQNVMGKIAYMAPEHARGEVVDARADQFSAAVVAYELFAGERYYGKLPQRDVWLHSGTGAWRPAGLGGLDGGLQAILTRALAADRQARFATCGDFRDALLAWGAARGLHPAGRELRQLMGEAFAVELEETRELLRRAAHLSAQPRPGFATPEGPRGPRDVFSIATSTHSAAIPDPTEMIRRADPLPATSGRRPVALALAGGLGVVALGIVLVLTSRSPTPDADPPPAEPVSAPSPPAPAPTPPPPAPPPPAPTPPAEAPPTLEVPAPAKPRSAPEPRSTRRRTPPPPRPSTAPATATFADQMRRLNRCDAPCARELVKWKGQLQDHPDLAGFRRDVDRCLKVCGP